MTAHQKYYYWKWEMENMLHAKVILPHTLKPIRLIIKNEIEKVSSSVLRPLWVKRIKLKRSFLFRSFFFIYDFFYFFYDILKKNYIKFIHSINFISKKINNILTLKFNKFLNLDYEFIMDFRKYDASYYFFPPLDCALVLKKRRIEKEKERLEALKEQTILEDNE